MKRALYRLLVWLHPPGFRDRFEPELLGTFDEAAKAEQAFYVSEMLGSLLRQWLRKQIWRYGLAAFIACVPVLLSCLFERSLKLYLLSIGTVTDAPAILFFVLICMFLMFATGIVVFWFQLVSRRKIRRRLPVRAACLLAMITFLATMRLCSQPSATTPDTSPHQVQFVPVEKDVKLEVLDWGGSGRSLILLAGGGFDAHEFDQFAPKLTSWYHVYGITRRGSGKSSAPAPEDSNYSADRLGDDVLAVMDVLKLQRPVLVGHSVAGEELSSIATRFPDKVSGLVYLEAAYAYAFYDRNAAKGDPIVDSNVLRDDLAQLFAPASTREHKAQVSYLLKISLPRIESDLQEVLQEVESMPDSDVAPTVTPERRISAAILHGVRAYGPVKCPVLAVFADPHSMGPAPGESDAARAARVADDRARTTAQADAFQSANPQARVVRIANGDHFIFRSNEAEVLAEIKRFVDALPQN